MKMKNIKYFIYGAALLLCCSCVEEQLEKGTPDRDDCMGVYFVEEQENIKDHTLVKGEDEAYLEFKVRRTDVSEIAKIPYEFNVYRVVKEEATDTSYMEVPKQDLNKFKFDKEIVFDKGQRETTVKVEFEGITTGEKFNCSMSITDPRYVSTYSNNSSSITFSISMFEWVKMKGVAIYRDALFSDMFGWEGQYLENKEVEIYERKDKKHYYRMKGVYSAKFLARLVEGEEAYELNPKALETEYGKYIDEEASILLDATDSTKVYFPAQKTGFSDPSLGDIFIASDVSEVFGAASNYLYGKRENGVITFPENGLLFGMGGYYYFSNTSGKARIVLPGGKAEDYGIELKAGEVKEDGLTTITFKVAKDVKKIRYSIFEGKISDVALEDSLAKAATSTMEIIPDGDKLEIEKEIRPLDNDAESGIYTVLACSYGTEGDKYHDYAQVEFGYVKPGDDRKVQIFYGLHADDRFSSDKPEENFSGENSFQYWVKGKDITHAQISYYPTSFYNTYSEQIKKQMMSYGSVDNLTLKVLNKDGLSGIIGNSLQPGTSYTFIIYAGNGYYSEFFIGTVTTQGEPDPMQQTYYKTDIEAYYQSEEKAEADQSLFNYEGTWVPVSVDIFDSEAKGRTIRGNWRGNEITLTTDGELVTASGLFPSLKTNPDIDFTLKDGLMYTMENKGARVTVKDSTNMIPSLRFEYTYIPKTGALSGNGYFYGTFDDDELEDRADMMVGGFVDEDIIAFVDNATKHQFWAMIMGGYQKSSMGEEVFSDIIGDAHGELILVRKGSELLNSLEQKESEAMAENQTLASLTESHRIVMPEINSIIKDLEKFDVAQELLQFNADVKVRSRMEY